MKYVHIFITGRVQGVFYRAFTKKSGDDCGVKGWVRNVPDGRVEVFAVGAEDKIDSFTDKLRAGPPASRVDDVDVTVIAPEDAEEEYSDFQILR
ncbi:MAG: acylphosphatase [Candidatus Nanohalarchaeota archaeon]|nr:MAG: acylphosphatase [Candidatus Nanohaloarchaeota archaeon]